MKKTTIAIAGASGFVGEHLINSLLSKNYSIVALSRRGNENNINKNIEWKKCDLFSRKDTYNSLRGCDYAFYLIHSMSKSARLSQGNFSDYDLVLADNFSRAAKLNKIKKVIYLGGIIPEDALVSKHLLSRLEVERTLIASGVDVIPLRAGIILGSQGSSFRIMYNLVKRLPIMICPSWTSTLSNPIAIEDVVDSLNYCLENKELKCKSYDIGGATTLSYLEMMRIIAKKIGRKRFLLNVPFFSPQLSKLWVSTFSGAPKELVYPLIGSLKTHMVTNIHCKLEIKNKKYLGYSESIDKIISEYDNLKKIPSAFESFEKDNSKTVRSIQRLETLYRFNAREVSDLYFKWLHDMFPIIRVSKQEKTININIKGFKKPILVLSFEKDLSSEDFCLFYIKNGFLSEGKGRGRLIFRTIIDGRNTMVEIHEFIPRLPWFIYKYTQALIHLVTMKMFNKYLLRLQRNITYQSY